MTVYTTQRRHNAHNKYPRCQLRITMAFVQVIVVDLPTHRSNTTRSANTNHLIKKIAEPIALQYSWRM